MSALADRSSFRFLIAVAAGLTCTAALAIGLTVWWSHENAIRDTSANNVNLATVLAEQTNRSVQSIDIVLNEIKSQLEWRVATTPDQSKNLLRNLETNKLLTERLSVLSQSKRVWLVDKDGRAVNSTIFFPSAEIDDSDRDYFQHFKDNDDKDLYITQILSDRREGRRLIVFSRRINGANNEFVGVAAIGVEFNYFESIYKSIASLREQSFELSHRDGTIIVRYPDSKTHTGEKLPPGAAWYRAAAQGGGEFQTRSVFDGQPRLVAVRLLRDYPLAVSVGVSAAAALATWRIQAITIGIGTLLVMVCSGFLLRALSRQFGRLAASETKLARANTTVDAALNNMSQGLAMFDSSQRLVVCNQRYLEMYGLSAEHIKPGCTLLELLKHRIAVGNFFPDDPEQYRTELLAAVKQGTTFSRLTSLPDGRICSVVNHPIAGGGWVATHEDVTEEKRAEERISYAAHHDSLTGLPNRTLFNNQLEQALKRARRGERLAVLYLDLDHFKRSNDTLGHPIGDKLLKAVAARLRACVRDIDVVARLSGDEFAIIQSSLDRPSDAADLAKRVRDKILKPFNLDGHHIVVDISIGISIAPNDAAEVNELLKDADMALYEAKNAGRGTYCFYEPEMNKNMQTRAQLERDLQSALANGEFELFYQPVVNLETNKITSFEALLRWHHPQRGLVPPIDFIPIAEEMGFIIPLGEWVIRTACAEAANWPDDIRVAVNLSAIQLKSKNLVNVIIGAMASAGIAASRVELEITESGLLQNTFANLATLKALHECGVQFAMDDFGTGYSSLGYLMSFPFHRIKIDHSFITDLANKEEARAIVRAIADLGRNLGMRVTAEGVETEQQLQQVRLLGGTEVQGYLLGPPRPAPEIMRFLESSGSTSAFHVSPSFQIKAPSVAVSANEPGFDSGAQQRIRAVK